MSWYSELGFKKNPLDIRPNPNLVGLEREEKRLLNHIRKEEICFLNGLTGSGKTSMLMRIQETLRGHKFIYLDAHELPKDFNLEKELISKRGFFDRITLRKFPKKKPVLIIDEFQSTDPNLVLEARANWENPVRRKLKAIVIAQISRYLKNVTPSFMERLGSRTVELRPLDEDEMKQILKTRLYCKKAGCNYIDKISDDALSFIVKCSGNNPRRLLEYADELFEFHHTKFADRNPMLKEDYMVSYHGAKEILGLEKVRVQGFEKLDEQEDKKRHENNKKKPNPKFSRAFDKNEKRVLKFIEKSPRTTQNIANRLNISESSAARILSELKQKKAIVYAGKKDRKKLWQISPATKRLMVRV
ncbi:hypothetical protein JXB31_02075 [Candidatus Woesearchaeota archaeon]|nr:hypothetical protein [Candidatus Woesearchaeota archaeon]